MYHVTIHQWNSNELVVTPFLYWKYALDGLIFTNVPISYMDSISMEIYTYTRINERTIYRNVSIDDLSYIQLSPSIYYEIEAYEVMSGIINANSNGIETVANELGMYIPPNLVLPSIFFENNIKYYVTGPIYNDKEIFNQIGYIPYYRTRPELLYCLTHGVIPPFYYSNGSYYYLQVPINLNSIKNPISGDLFTLDELGDFFRLTEMVENSTLLRLNLIEMIHKTENQTIHIDKINVEVTKNTTKE